ncbi:MAG: Thiamine-phosphate synthase [Burkholderia plantarii]|nr:MAG: Thiamine-phosphate synthase [Burkholderia plantarii]
MSAGRGTAAVGTGFVDLFWPPADALSAAAERIRASLGAWPARTAPVRLCLAAPDQARRGDLLVVTHGDAHADRAAHVIAAGGATIEIDAHHATLTSADTVYRLSAAAPLAEDWTAALAAFLDCGFAPHDALVLALAWRDGDDASGRDAWPVDPARFPSMADASPVPLAFAPCPVALGLYPVVPTADWVERVLEYGARTVQLRVKGATPAELADEVRRAVAAGRRYRDARVFINDHWQLALDAGAYGVHLGQEDLHTADLDAIAAAGLRLGLSSHGYYEMLVALRLRPSYLALGPVYATQTKAVAAPPQGLARIARYARFAHSRVPLVAIGGVTRERLPDVIATGVGSVAVVSAVTLADDPRSEVAALQRAFAH